MNTVQKLEALLFIKGEPQSKKNICGTLTISESELGDAISLLREKYTSNQHGITLIDSSSDVGLITSPELSLFIESIEKEEKGGELSKASLETISIILYKKGATRSEIDYIRGVNSSFILRNLYLRGLIEKDESTKSTRSPKYVATVDLMRFLGISNIEELPDYSAIFNSLEETVQEEN